MSQYTDKINEIAKDFAYMEQQEGVSCLQATNGQMRTMYYHGGEKIEILRDGIEVEGKLYNKGDVIITDPVDSYYKDLRQKYNQDGPTLNVRITNWFANIRKRFIKNDRSRRFW